MDRAVAADAAGDDLAAIGDELLERLWIFVVDGRGLVREVLADALAGAAATERIVVEIRRAVAIEAVVVHVVVAHGLFPRSGLGLFAAAGTTTDATGVRLGLGGLVV